MLSRTDRGAAEQEPCAVVSDVEDLTVVQGVLCCGCGACEQAVGDLNEVASGRKSATVPALLGEADEGVATGDAGELAAVADCDGREIAESVALEVDYVVACAVDEVDEDSVALRGGSSLTSGDGDGGTLSKRGSAVVADGEKVDCGKLGLSPTLVCDLRERAILLEQI